MYLLCLFLNDAAELQVALSLLFAEFHFLVQLSFPANSECSEHSTFHFGFK
jgi:hypothetical protein